LSPKCAQSERESEPEIVGETPKLRQSIFLDGIRVGWKGASSANVKTTKEKLGARIDVLEILMLIFAGLVAIGVSGELFAPALAFGRVFTAVGVVGGAARFCDFPVESQAQGDSRPRHSNPNARLG
jgi:hypothetical protein